MKRQRALDFITSKPGIYLGLVLIVASFMAASWYFTQQYDDFRRQRSTLLGLKMREGFVALSDLQRINIVVLDALRDGGMTEDRIAALTRAADFLFVRIDAFERSVMTQANAEGASQALALMRQVLIALDEAKNEDYRNIEQLSRILSTLTDETRRLLFIFLDDQRRAQERLLNAQSDQLQWQTQFLTSILFFLTLIGGGALLLLLREGRLRKHVQEAEGRAQFLAYYDSLTGLPNRNQFRDRVLEHLAGGAPATMIFIDLDNFKGINDSLGHAAGDEVLRFAARHLAEQAEAFGAFAARIAGDEFALFLAESDIDRLELMADAILEAVKEPVEFEGDTISVGLSLGIAPSSCMSRKLPLNYESLSRVADFCLYASKAAGRGRYTIFNEELEQEFNARRAMLTELSEAIAQGEIEAWLQPKVVVESSEVFGFEALCRWCRGGTQVRPGDFIPLAESSGSIVELDLFVMHTACRSIAAWNERAGTRYSVSVNLSALHFRSGNIVDHIAEALRVSRLSAELLTLEITETVQLVNWDFVSGIFADIRKLGCRISIDDFGSGYSSLAYLRAMQADELKIDRSLVAEIESSEEARHVLSSVIDLAHSLGMRVIVEGIETRTQARILMELGCIYGQGFHFGMPMPAQVALERFGSTIGQRVVS